MSAVPVHAVLHNTAADTRPATPSLPPAAASVPLRVQSRYCVPAERAPELKKCSRCERDLPRTTEYFYACASKWDGLQTSCKECQTAYSRGWRERNPERHAENNARWQRENPDKANAKSRRWRAAHPEEFLEAVLRWQREHPEERRYLKRKAGRNRHARQKFIFVESVDDLVLFERDGGICGICHLLVDPDNWVVDHIIPIAHLGCDCGTHEPPTHSYANTRIAHASCNSWKGKRLDSELPDVPEHILRAARTAARKAA